MSFRQDEKGLAAWLQDVDRRLRRVEQAGANPPDRGFVLTEVGDSLHYIYVPSGSIGPEIGTK